MSGRHVIALALTCLVSCRDKGKQAPTDPDLPRASNADVVAIADAEAMREFGLAQLQLAVKSGLPEHRPTAVRGIGRIVSLTSVAALRSLSAFPDEDVLTQVGWAFANQGAANVADDAGREIARLLGRVKKAENRAVLLRALGRVARKELTSLLFASLADEDAMIRAAAALAYGLSGRRQVALSALEQDTLVRLASDPARDVRYGVAYAIARAHPGIRDPQAEKLLSKLAKDDDDETRAVALFGLARRGAQKKEFFLAALNDADWRVRVQAVRGLSSTTSTSSMRAHLASWLVQEWVAIADLAQRIDSPRVHPVLEGLRSLRTFGKERYVKEALEKLHEATDVTESTMRERYTPVLLRNIDAVNCLAAAGLLRAGRPLALLASCGETSAVGLPTFERKRLFAEAVGDGFGGRLDARVAKLGELYKDADARVRAAAATAALSINDARASRIVRQALLVKESVVVGSVVDGMLQKKQVDANVIDLLTSRAQKARGDPELLLSLVQALRLLKDPRTQSLCAPFVRDANVTLRQMARDCLKDLTSEDPGIGGAEQAPGKPPHPATQVLSKKILWRVYTSRGVFSIELAAAQAPWNVATLTALAQKGFYDGLLWHRVVPDFVAQGGDPEGSGWGGPGFSVPGEPSSALFDRGAVGVADAGLDTGGSQWFIMHSRAPHLEGRYTKVGQVVEGMDVVDKLQVADIIERIEVVVDGGVSP